MGLYVEVMCDERKSGRATRSVLEARCWSDQNANPQGPTVAAAQAAARDEGWKVGPGRKAVCPGCLERRPGDALTKEQDQ